MSMDTARMAEAIKELSEAQAKAAYKVKERLEDLEAEAGRMVDHVAAIDELETYDDARSMAVDLRDLRAALQRAFDALDGLINMIE